MCFSLKEITKSIVKTNQSLISTNISMHTVHHLWHQRIKAWKNKDLNKKHKTVNGLKNSNTNLNWQSIHVCSKSNKRRRPRTKFCNHTSPRHRPLVSNTQLVKLTPDESTCPELLMCKFWVFVNFPPYSLHPFYRARTVS